MTKHSKRYGRDIRHRRVRKKIFGTPEMPRLCIFRSLRHIYGQLIDDTTGKTLCSVATDAKDFRAATPHTGNIDAASKAGKIIGEKIKSAGIQKVVFDRGGYLYHGRVKAFAEGAREAGVEF